MALEKPQISPPQALLSPLVSVVLPCLNEEEGIASCIHAVQSTFLHSKIRGELIVVDNGCTDRTAEIARTLGATIVAEPSRGYGRAYQKGFSEASGRYLIMGDGDATYDFKLIPRFLEKLVDGGCDFVSGSRKSVEGMPLLHRYFGNPLFTLLLNFMFGTKYTDVHCGFRAFSRATYDRIRPVSPGMEFNLELAINAGLARLKTAEIPINLGRRKGTSKLRTFRDGWRALSVMILCWSSISRSRRWRSHS